WKTSDYKQYGKELGWEAHRTVDQASVGVYGRVELAGYEVIISQSDLFELHSKVEKLVAAEVSKNLVSGFVDDCRAWVVVLVHAVAEAHQADVIYLVLHDVRVLDCVAIVFVLVVF